MTIEIADRLVKLRKKYGYSQEELADKLGLSRQAVSKWERAEASPDTDNLICLAKLYGVSLDELLATDEDIDTIVDEQVKDKEEKDEHADDRVVINNNGVTLHDKKGNTVKINNDGVTKIDKDGNVTKKEVDTAIAVIGTIEGGLCILATIAYILLGSLLGLWGSAWVLFLVPEILCSIMRAIRKKNAQHFNMAFLATFVFFFVCMWYPGLDAQLWHPMWVVFFAIPLYHTSVGALNKALGKEEENHCKKCEEKDEDDDDEEDDD